MYIFFKDIFLWFIFFYSVCMIILAKIIYHPLPILTLRLSESTVHSPGTIPQKYLMTSFESYEESSLGALFHIIVTL